ncbi:MAG: site-2 protease family protein [Candidatus Bathyarchaeia archaeon]
MSTASSENQKEKKIQFSIPLILIKSKRGLSLLDRLAKLKATKPAGWAFLYFLPLAAAGGLFLIISAVSILATNSAARSIASEAGPLANILLPGINPFVPVFYGIIAIVIGLVVHEGAHGILARSLGFPVKATGLMLFLGIPIGAFVEIDDNELKKARARDSGRVLAAGPGGNIIAGVISLAFLIAIIGSMSPVADGFGVVGLVEGYPAQKVGLRQGDIILEVNGAPISTRASLLEEVGSLKPGSEVSVKIWRSGHVLDYSIMAVASPDGSGRSILGVSGVGTTESLENYKQITTSSPTGFLAFLVPPTFSGAIVPYSDSMQVFFTSSLGEAFFPLANFFFWIWFVNINLAIFNALPIYPLDGGHALSAALRGLGKGKWREHRITVATRGVTLSMVLLIASLLLLPYVG